MSFSVFVCIRVCSLVRVSYAAGAGGSSEVYASQVGSKEGGVLVNDRSRSELRCRSSQWTRTSGGQIVAAADACEGRGCGVFL